MVPTWEAPCLSNPKSLCLRGVGTAVRVHRFGTRYVEDLLLQGPSLVTRLILGSVEVLKAIWGRRVMY